MKMYTIIGGVNGVGKSSFSGSLKAQTTDLGIIIDVENTTAENGGNLIDGGGIAAPKIEKCLNEGYSFTQETTLCGEETALTAKRARELGYYIRLYYIGLDTLEESLERIENRVKKGGHDVNAETVEQNFKSRFKSLWAVLPYCDEVMFLDNRNGFLKVAEYSNGEITVTDKLKPLWFKEFLEG